MNLYNNPISPAHRCEMSEEEIEDFSLIRTRAEKLLAIALQFDRTNEAALFDSLRIVREELASNADFFLPRGYYCPSPVLDLIVGNCKRGKILKRLTSRSRVSHRYIYGDQGLMIIEYIGDKGITDCCNREYLLREELKTIGVSFDRAGRINQVSEELFEDGRITDYFRARFNGLDGNYRLYHSDHEQYSYDERGLCQCNFKYASHGYWPVINRETYIFNRANGYLQSYYSVKNPSVIYTPKVKRLAMPPYFVK